MKHTALGAFTAAIVALGTSGAALAEYPTKALNWVIPFGAGGGTDKLVRSLQEHSETYFTEMWTVENRAGAGGTVGWQHVLNQPADGYTVLVGSVTPVITVLQESSPPFTPEDIKIVAYYSLADLALITRDDNEWSNFGEFLDYAKANPGEVTIGGSNAALLPMAYVFDQLGVDVNLIPYSGGGAATTDVVGGHIDGVSLGTNKLEDLGSDLLGVATFGAQDLPEDTKARVGDVDWIGDFGADGMAVPRFVGLHPDTPDEIVAALSAELETMLTDEALVAEYRASGENITFYATERATEEYNKFVDTTRRFLPLLNQN